MKIPTWLRKRPYKNDINQSHLKFSSFGFSICKVCIRIIVPFLNIHIVLVWESNKVESFQPPSIHSINSTVINKLFNFKQFYTFKAICANVSLHNALWNFRSILERALIIYNFLLISIDWKEMVGGSDTQ